MSSGEHDAIKPPTGLMPTLPVAPPLTGNEAVILLKLETILSQVSQLDRKVEKLTERQHVNDVWKAEIAGRLNDGNREMASNSLKCNEIERRFERELAQQEKEFKHELDKAERRVKEVQDAFETFKKTVEEQYISKKVVLAYILGAAGTGLVGGGALLKLLHL